MSESAERLKRLRKDMLRVLHSARPSPVSGEMVRDSLDTLADRIVVPVEVSSGLTWTPDREIMQLASDLENLDLITISDFRTHKRQRESLVFVAFKITSKGSALVDELIPPEPLVADERL